MGQKFFISVILPLKLEWEPCYSVPENLLPVETGDRVRVIFASKEYIGVVSAADIIPDTAPEKIRPIMSIEHGMEKVSEKEIMFWRQVADYYLCTVGEVSKAAYPISKVHLEEAKAKSEQKARLRHEKAVENLEAKLTRLQERLEKKNLQIENARKDSTREAYIAQAEIIKEDMAQTERRLSALTAGPSFEGTDPAVAIVPELTAPQTTALEDILEAFKEEKPALVHGITGSGKTEIYAEAARRTLEKGRNVLYLVPEIALSRQLEDRLYGYFGDRLMTFHSAQTAAGRRNIADRIRNSDPRNSYIVLGTRSSLFLPHHDLGLIIIDEEHDNSYKQDSPAPRYHGRDTALMLAKLHKSDVILGSATPSLESLYNCHAGKYRMISLNERFHGSEDSAVEVIDTRAERRKRGMRGSFSIKLIEHIKETLEAGEQVIILRSRRAYSPALQCTSCGEIQKCPHCNVSLSLHRPQDTTPASGKVVCHHCGWSAPFRDNCIKCGSPLMLLGAGTQKIEEEAAILFPQARIARLDSDTAQNRTFEAETIRDFSNGKTDILIGTQIISKGFDFSNLSLVVIISADTLLAQHDFRADEKAVQLLEQLRGRCGRRGSKGLFVIQTSQPQHPVYQRLLNNDARQFSYDLLAERKDFRFPPYSRIISITIRDIYDDRATRMASALAAALRESGLDVTGPYPPIPDRIADQHIRCMRISFAKDRSLAERKTALKQAVARFEKERNYSGHIIIDVDPS